MTRVLHDSECHDLCWFLHSNNQEAQRKHRNKPKQANKHTRIHTKLVSVVFIFHQKLQHLIHKYLHTKKQQQTQTTQHNAQQTNKQTKNKESTCTISGASLRMYLSTRRRSSSVLPSFLNFSATSLYFNSLCVRDCICTYNTASNYTQPMNEQTNNNNQRTDLHFVEDTLLFAREMNRKLLILLHKQ